MVPSRLQQIVIVFPRQHPDAPTFWSSLVRLLGDIPQADVQQDRITFAPTHPVGALPCTRIEQDDVPCPQVIFSPALPLERTVGGLSIGDTRSHPEIMQEEGTPSPAHLSIQDLAERLSGHVTRLDHSGVNVTPAMIDQQEWDTLMRHCASSAALYRYPGEQWPFILPATEEEMRADIGQFALGREPKFEFVYDTGPDQPIVQFSLDTDLMRAELETLFPDPEGMVIPGLEDIFRSVYIRHPWPGVILRFDLTYHSEGSASDWATGEWLAVNGARIRAM